MELLNKTKNNEIMLGAELLQETTSVNWPISMVQLGPVKPAAQLHR